MNNEKTNIVAKPMIMPVKQGYNEDKNLFFIEDATGRCLFEAPNKQDNSIDEAEYFGRLQFAIDAINSYKHSTEDKRS